MMRSIPKNSMWARDRRQRPENQMGKLKLMRVGAAHVPVRAGRHVGTAAGH
jgi:hypothetical protein